MKNDMQKTGYMINDNRAKNKHVFVRLEDIGNLIQINKPITDWVNRSPATETVDLGSIPGRVKP